jgi:hypothetical protein
VATLDEKAAFEAMRHFLETYWERGGRSSDDLASLLGSLNTDRWADDAPADPAMWRDWMDAVGRATAFR